MPAVAGEDINHQHAVSLRGCGIGELHQYHDVAGKDIKAAIHFHWVARYVGAARGSQCIGALCLKEEAALVQCDCRKLMFECLVEFVGRGGECSNIINIVVILFKDV